MVAFGLRVLEKKGKGGVDGGVGWVIDLINVNYASS